MTEKIKVLIIENDADTVEYLKEIIQAKIKNASVVGTADTIVASIELINVIRPEIILMDIVLDDGSAFSILDAYPKPDFEVIFISAHGQFLEKALEYYAMNFLTKPIDSERLVALFQKHSRLKQRMFAFHKYELLKDLIFENGKKFLLHVGSKHVSIGFSDVVYCTADGNYTVFHLGDKRKLLASGPLKYYSEILEKKGFFRANRFHLINLEHITSIYKKETIILSNNDKINISKRNKSKLLMLIKDLSL